MEFCGAVGRDPRKNLFTLGAGRKQIQDIFPTYFLIMVFFHIFADFSVNN